MRKSEEKTCVSTYPNKLIAEYALRGLDQSIAVAQWQTQLTESLPKELRSSLPSIEEVEAELSALEETIQQAVAKHNSFLEELGLPRLPSA